METIVERIEDRRKGQRIDRRVSDDDRRQHDRFTICIPAEVFIKDDSEITKVVDISLGGCKLRCDNELVDNQSVSIEFFMANEKADDFDNCEQIDAKVLRSIHDGTEYVASLKFITEIAEKHCIQSILYLHGKENPYTF